MQGMEAILAAYGTPLVGALALLSGLAIVMGLRPRRANVAQRLGGPVIPGDAADAELAQPFAERALRPFLRAILSFLGRLSPKSGIEQHRKLILLAGNPGGLTVLDVLGLKLLCGALGLALGMGLALRGVQPRLQKVLWLALPPLIGYYLPTYSLKRHARRRQHLIERALPDVLDMLTICVESGLGLEAAMLRLQQQWDNVLTQELRRTVYEMRMGVSRAEALRHLVQRTEVPDLASFVAVVNQAEQLGVSIATVLRTQADQMRIIRRQRAEERARGAPFKMIFAMVFLIFPAIFIVILGPSIPRFQSLFATFVR
jgi:tight adherence protein C